MMGGAYVLPEQTNKGFQRGFFHQKFSLYEPMTATVHIIEIDNK